MGLVPLEEREEYDAAVGGAEVCVVSFLAGWSKPCKALKQELLTASEQDQHAAIHFFEVDLEAEEGEALALDVGVAEPPTVVVFPRGHEACRIFVGQRDIGSCDRFDHQSERDEHSDTR